ncbi:MAG: DUF4386 domain-containing protein [Vicinamibacterales bacterium]
MIELRAIEPAQRKAATIVGIAYLFAMAASMFTEGYIRGTLVVADATVTAQNILNHQLLFRIGLGVEILTFLSDATLIAALVVILTPINRHLALYAAFLRVAAVSVGIMMAAHGFDALRILGNPEYLRVFQTDQLAALARLSIGTHSTQYAMVFIFLGFGSTVFAYLWLRSGYVPKALAMLGIVASLALAIGTFSFFIVPSLQGVLYPLHMVPMFFFETGMGLWLLIKGLPK